MIAHLVKSGCITNSIVVHDGATIAADGSSISWGNVVLEAPAGATYVVDPGAAIGWTMTPAGLAPPSPTVSLADAVAVRLAELRAACASAIVGGFESAALGAVHLYPSGPTDQTNLLGSVVASMLPSASADSGWSTPFWCRDPSGAWAFREHSAAEIQRVGADGKGHVTTCQARLDRLTERLAAAETIGAVGAITWEG